MDGLRLQNSSPSQYAFVFPIEQIERAASIFYGAAINPCPDVRQVRQDEQAADEALARSDEPHPRAAQAYPPRDLQAQEPLGLASRRGAERRLRRRQDQPGQNISGEFRWA